MATKRTGLLIFAVIAMVVTSCGALASTPSAADTPLAGGAATPTPVATSGAAQSTTTPTPVVIPTTPARPTATPTDTAGTEATPTPRPIPTAAPTSSPQSTATPQPTTQPTPRPTTQPTPRPTVQPTATAQPTATPWPTSVPVTPVVTCAITPTTAVTVNQTLVFTAKASPANVPIDFVFDHGDGTLDPTSVSNAYYQAPGTYAVKLRWSNTAGQGVVSCGNVTVVNDANCVIGLGPADGLGWWCGNTFCRQGDPNQASFCPTEAPYGCYTGMDGQRRCIDPPGTDPDCLVGQGPADGFVWYCDGVLCNPQQPFEGCPAYPIYGCHETVSGPTICIDPAPAPVISCTVSATTAVVNQVLTFRAVQTGSQIPVDFVFNHGDGTLDPTRVSSAYYAAPGTYTVTMTWNHALGSGEETCGTIVVS